ncbi:tyrosine-type recombinase/integrase [Methylobacterium sp. J-092]|nr:tyrosine-type recombinase/integrase [Methylobacterium sp. J-092]
MHRVVKAAVTRAGLPTEVSAHWLRHAHASHSLDRGAPIHLVQATVEHASVATTGRYLHARPSESSARFLGV